MNWEFHAVHGIDAVAMIKEYSALAAEGIEVWLATHVEPKEKQEEAGYTEFASGFFRDESKDPFAYRFRFRCGYYGKSGYVSLDPPEYDVTVQQTFYPQGKIDATDKWFSTRFRRIKDAPPIC